MLTIVGTGLMQAGFLHEMNTQSGKELTLLHTDVTNPIDTHVLHQAVIKTACFPKTPSKRPRSTTPTQLILLLNVQTNFHPLSIQVQGHRRANEYFKTTQQPRLPRSGQLPKSTASNTSYSAHSVDAYLPLSIPDLHPEYHREQLVHFRR